MTFSTLRKNKSYSCSQFLKDISFSFKEKELLFDCPFFNIYNCNIRADDPHRFRVNGDGYVFYYFTKAIVLSSIKNFCVVSIDGIEFIFYGGSND